MKKAGATARNPKPDVHFRVTVEEYSYLQTAAKAMDRSVSYLIAQIVREWIAKRKAAPSPRRL